jgi:predicted neuraminidase
MSGLVHQREDDPARLEADLPAPCVQSHAANVMPLRDGSIGCVWFGGTQEGVADISVWFSHLATGSRQWSTPVPLSDDATRSEQNPILFNVPDGKLWLLHTAQKSGNQDTAVVRYRVSEDDGRTWGPTGTLFGERAGIFVRQPVVVLDNGDWLVPIFHCRTEPNEKWAGNNDDSAVMISSDQGRSWTEVAVPESTGCVHMNIVKADGGKLLGFFRSRWADNIYRSVSTDNGRRWSTPRPTPLPNNNSSIQVTRLAGGRLAMIYNHSSAADATERRVSLYDEIDDGDGRKEPVARGRSAFWGAPRAPMTLALSSDDGLTWPQRRNLEVGDGYCMTNNSADKRNREYSYPSIQQTADGAIHVAYTVFRQKIRYARVDEAWVEAA